MRTFPTPALASVCGALMTLLPAAPAEAHAFGERYDLPLPLDFYLSGAGAAVALSFVVMALVFRTRPAAGQGWQIDVLRWAPVRALVHPVPVGALRALSAGLFLLVLAAGLFGSNETLENFAPTFVWIIWWVGLAYVAALAGNAWPVVNPWTIIFDWVTKLTRPAPPGARPGSALVYPPALGVWPAVALFAAFAWVELNVDAARDPATLATFILLYSGFTWLGMVVFGRDVWLARGEAFSLAFDVFGRFAPLGRAAPDGADPAPPRLVLRPYAHGLVVDRPRGLSMTVFVLLMLATVTFDGFKETPLRAGLLEWVAVVPWFRSGLLTLHRLGYDLPGVLDTVTFVLFPLLFFLVFVSVSWLAKEMADFQGPATEVAGWFVLSLVPIAIAYHLAHYLSYLLLSGQRIIALVSDPFGVGWDLFGTADYDIDITIVGAKFVWYTAVVAIVVGHVFAVGVAHLVALRVFATARAALASQVPFLILMVGYTMISLWILAQPVVEAPRPYILRAPSGTLSLAPYQFRELCLAKAAGEEIRYDFRADGPLDFDIHYHQASAVHTPLQLTAVSERADRFVAGADQSYCLTWSNPGVSGVSMTYRVSGP